MAVSLQKEAMLPIQMDGFYDVWPPEHECKYKCFWGLILYVFVLAFKKTEVYNCDNFFLYYQENNKAAYNTI